VQGLLRNSLKFQKKHRLLHKLDFQPVFDESSRLRFKYLIVLYRPNFLDHARLGLIISKKHLKHAVDRNLLRRIIRESFRAVLSSLQSVDIIVITRGSSVEMDKQHLRQDADELWKKLAG